MTDDRHSRAAPGARARVLVKGAARWVAAHCGAHRRWAPGARLWILMYHRVIPREQARLQAEEPGMWVSPGTFRRHLSWLRDEIEIVRLADWLHAVRSGGTLPRKACAITFDDGWHDNFVHALPALEEHAAPATLFAVSHMLGTGKLFWPTRLTRVILSGGPGVATNPVLARLRKVTPIGTVSRLDEDAISDIIAACKGAPEPELLAWLDTEERQAPSAECDVSQRLLDYHELKAMQETGLVEIGSHTSHHVRLNDAAPPALIASEVVESKKRIEAELGSPVRLFCYPNGDTCPTAVELVARHYEGAVTTGSGINTPATPRHSLKRIGMHEDISATRRDFLARLSGWV